MSENLIRFGQIGKARKLAAEIAPAALKDVLKRIFRKHGGNIRFASQPGDTRFQVRLPLEPKN